MNEKDIVVSHESLGEQKEKNELRDVVEDNKTKININDPNEYFENEPFPLKDTNGETIISKTAKGINEGLLNPFEVNWMEVTLYLTSFIKPLLESINSELMLDVAQAIDNEMLAHLNEDGHYTYLHSRNYGQGQHFDFMYSGQRDNFVWRDSKIVIKEIAKCIIDKRKNIEEYNKKQKLHPKRSAKILSGWTISQDSEYSKLLKENEELKKNIEILEVKNEDLKKNIEILEVKLHNAERLNIQKFEKAPEKAYNVQTNSLCFTNKQMSIFLYAIAMLTEKKTPGKTTLGNVVQRIAGYSSKTSSQNMKGLFSEKDKNAVADAIEEKFPELAKKVRSL